MGAGTPRVALGAGGWPAHPDPHAAGPLPAGAALGAAWAARGPDPLLQVPRGPGPLLQAPPVAALVVLAPASADSAAASAGGVEETGGGAAPVLPPMPGPDPAPPEASAAAATDAQQGPLPDAASAGAGTRAAGHTAAAQAAHRAAVAAGKQPAAADPTWPELGMPPVDAPLSAAAFRGQQADAALAAAFLAAKSEASAAQERVRAAALA